MSKQQNKRLWQGLRIKVSRCCKLPPQNIYVFAIISAAAGSFSCRHRPQRYLLALGFLIASSSLVCRGNWLLFQANISSSGRLLMATQRRTLPDKRHTSPRAATTHLQNHFSPRGNESRKITSGPVLTARTRPNFLLNTRSTALCPIKICYLENAFLENASLASFKMLFCVFGAHLANLLA